jgi:hypothetical protein
LSFLAWVFFSISLSNKSWPNEQAATIIPSMDDLLVQCRESAFFQDVAIAMVTVTPYFIEVIQNRCEASQSQNKRPQIKLVFKKNHQTFKQICSLIYKK